VRTRLRSLLRALVLVAITALAAACSQAPDAARRPAPKIAATPDDGAALPATAPTVSATPPAVVRRQPEPEPSPPPGPQPGFTLLGHTDLDGRGYNGGVRVHDGYAFVGSWGGGGACPAQGFRVVDLSDPTRPTVVTAAARYPGTTAEELAVLPVSTPFYAGTLLAVGIQRCTAGNGARGGLALFDVTDPHTPVELAFFSTGASGRGVHELDLARQDGRVLALLAVPGSGEAGDLRIVDVTDPRTPRQVGAWNVHAALGPTAGYGCERSVYAHSVRAGRDGRLAFVSYWDAGEIILDISTPEAPRELGRALQPDTEGSVHSADEMEGGLLLVAAEYPFFNDRTVLTVGVEAGGVQRQFLACEASTVSLLTQTGRLTGPLVYAGEGCVAANTTANAVVLVEEGGCGLSAKVRRAQADGARAVIVIERDALAPPLGDTGGRLPLPVVGVAAAAGPDLRALAAGRPTVTLPLARPWGGLSVWDIRDPAAPRLLAGYRTPNAEAFPPPGPGIFTIHNPVSVGRYALLAWYSDGVRLLDLSNPDAPRELAAWVPPPSPDPFGTFPSAAMVWGVARMGNVVVASDINGGLYVLRLDGIELP
jgi:hypothetical protein